MKERKVFLLLFGVSFSLLILEISLTRVFSFLFRYHYAFLAISFALLGLGLGGVLSHYLSKRGEPSRYLPLLLEGASLWLFISSFLLFATPLATYMGIYIFASLFFLPVFLLGGAFVSLLLREYARIGGRVYFYDLLGSSLGCLLVVPLLDTLGGLNILFCLSFLLALLSFLSKPGLKLALPLLMTLFIFLLQVIHPFLDIPPIKKASPRVTKPLLLELREAQEEGRIEYTIWNSFARTDVVGFKGAPYKYIYTDGETPSPMVPFKKEEIEDLRRHIGFLPFLQGKKDKILSIGPGGGVDILLAILGGYGRFEGVEVNKALPRIMKRYAKFNGGIYERKGIRIFVGEGRSFLARSRDKYDLLMLSLTQTATAGGEGLVLVESYIHTKEAIKDYIEHLSPGGEVALIFQEEPLVWRAGKETIEVLKEMGEKEPLKHLFWASVPEEEFGITPYRHLLLVKREPFSKEEAERMRKGTFKMRRIPRFVPYLYEVNAPFLLGERDFVGDLNISPCRDENPFFLDLSHGIPYPLRNPLIFIGALLFLAWLSISWRGNAPFHSLYFLLIGVGFMLIEIPLVQKFILFVGYPTLSLSLILFSLLTSASLGSLASQRVKGLRRGAMLGGLGIFLIALIMGKGLSSLLGMCLGWGDIWRYLLTFALIFPLGFLLGLPFPLGVRDIGKGRQELIPWMWLLNGFASVFGAILASGGAKIWGFSNILLFGGGLYLLLTVGLLLKRK